MKKSGAAIVGAMALSASLAMAGVAGAQDDPTTTVPAAPETTAAPTTAAPETTAAPTTGAPETTVPEAPVEPPVDEAPPADPGPILEPIALPGNVVTSGTLDFAVNFADSPTSSCSGTVALSGGQMNVAYDEIGRIGGVYGLTSTGSGTLGALFVGLGPVPAGIGVVSVSDANCEFDAIGTGAWESTASSATLNGIGFGLHPGVYDTGSYVDKFSLKASVGATGGPAVLDLGQLESFLLRERPGLIIDLPTTTTTPPAAE